MEFRLKIFTPYTNYYDSMIQSMSLKTPNGRIGIYSNHENMISNVEISNLKIIENGVKKNFAISDGVLEFKHKENEAILILSSIESVEEIDIERAIKAKQNAEKLILSAKTVKELSNAEVKLKKALNRISVKGGNSNAR